MTPPNLKKMTKKELRHAYQLQWNQNILLRSENEKSMMYGIKNERLKVMYEDEIVAMRIVISETQEALSRSRAQNKSLREQLERNKTCEDLRQGFLNEIDKKDKYFSTAYKSLSSYDEEGKGWIRGNRNALQEFRILLTK